MKFLTKHRSTFLRLMGLAIFIVSLSGIYHQVIELLWEGLGLITLGTLLFWKPEEIAKLALGIIKKLSSKLLKDTPDQAG